MSDQSPAARVQHLRDRLAWASALLAQQPESIRLSYAQAAASIASALKSETRQFTLTLPNRVIEKGVETQAPRPLLMLRAGSVITRLRGQSVRSHLVAELQKLSAQKHDIVACCASLTAYEAGRLLIESAVAAEPQIPSMPTLGETSTEADIEAAKAVVDQMTQTVGWLRDAEALFPGWGLDDGFDEVDSRLRERLIAAGRALAMGQTQRIIDDLRARYEAGKFLNGLTVYVPYLDERAYVMAEYTLDVVPNARIPFYPEFMVGACRLAEREVRDNPRFSQATRWQLLSQLDLLRHTFETAALKS